RMVGLPQSPSKLSNDTFTRFAMTAVPERRGVTTPVDEDHSIQALIVDRAHEALRVWIQIGRPWRDISRATALSEKTDQRPDGGNGWCWPGVAFARSRPRADLAVFREQTQRWASAAAGAEAAKGAHAVGSQLLTVV